MWTKGALWRSPRSVLSRAKEASDRIRLISVSIALFLSLSRGSVGSADASGVVETQTGTVSFTVVEASVGEPESELDRMIAVGMKEGCLEARSSGIRASIRPLVIVWRLLKEGRRPVIVISAELFSAGRSVTSTSSQSAAISAAPNVVFESEIARVTCSLFRKAGFVRP